MEEDLAEELQFHLLKEIEKNVRAGMSPEEARYAALRIFGVPLQPIWRDPIYSQVTKSNQEAL